MSSYFMVEFPHFFQSLPRRLKVCGYTKQTLTPCFPFRVNPLSGGHFVCLSGPPQKFTVRPELTVEGEMAHLWRGFIVLTDFSQVSQLTPNWAGN